MGVERQHHALDRGGWLFSHPGYFISGAVHLVCIGEGLCGPQSQCGCCAEEKNLLYLLTWALKTVTFSFDDPDSLLIQ